MSEETVVIEPVKWVEKPPFKDNRYFECERIAGKLEVWSQNNIHQPWRWHVGIGYGDEGYAMSSDEAMQRCEESFIKIVKALCRSDQ